MKRIAVTTLFLFVGACAGTGKSTIASLDALREYTTPSELNRNVERYDRSPIVVRGLLVLGFEKRYLVDSRKALEDWPSNDVCVTLLNVGHLLGRDEINGHMVELQGTFHRDVLSQGVVRLGACNTTGIEVNQSIDPQVTD